MRLHIDQPPCPRDRRVIRRLLVEPDSQKSPQPERIRRSPSDPALRIDSFKIPNQQQPKIDPRHQRGPPVVCGVKLRALPLGERIELSLFQQFIHSLVERMAWPLRQFIVADPQPLLPLSAPSCPHRHRGLSRLRWHSTRTSDTNLTSKREHIWMMRSRRPMIAGGKQASRDQNYTYDVQFV